MKISAVDVHARSRTFIVQVGARTYSFPFARTDPRPSPADPVKVVTIDDEIGREGFIYRLASGREGTVHTEQVLEHNQDPALLRDRTLYLLTLEAQALLESQRRAKRDVIRQLGTSASQLYRLLDQTNYAKSVDQMLELLAVLGAEVELRVVARPTDG